MKNHSLREWTIHSIRECKFILFKIHSLREWKSHSLVTTKLTKTDNDDYADDYDDCGFQQHNSQFRYIYVGSMKPSVGRQDYEQRWN